MKIVTNTLTLQQLFLVANEQFSIPAYQRRYAWGLKQQRELFDDIRLLPDSDSHLFGTVLFHRIPLLRPSTSWSWSMGSSA